MFKALLHTEKFNKITVIHISASKLIHTLEVRRESKNEEGRNILSLTSLGNFQNLHRLNY